MMMTSPVPQNKRKTAPTSRLRRRTYPSRTADVELRTSRLKRTTLPPITTDTKALSSFRTRIDWSAGMAAQQTCSYLHAFSCARLCLSFSTVSISPSVSWALNSCGRISFSAGARFLLRCVSASLSRQVRLRVASAGRPVGLRTARSGGTLSSMAQKRPLKMLPTLQVRSPYPRSDISQFLKCARRRECRRAKGRSAPRF